MKKLNLNNIELTNSKENKRILSHHMDEEEINKLLRKDE